MTRTNGQRAQRHANAQVARTVSTNRDKRRLTEDEFASPEVVAVFEHAVEEARRTLRQLIAQAPDGIQIGTTPAPSNVFLLFVTARPGVLSAAARPAP